MKRKIELTNGEIAIVKDVMIALDGKNIEEGIDIWLETPHFNEDEYIGSMLGVRAESVTAEEIEWQI